MISTYTIPLTSNPQTFEINLANVNYTLTLVWNDEMANMDSGDTGWILNIGDESGNPIVSGIPLITGVDLLGQLQYLGIQGSLAVYTNGDSSAVPTFTNLGTDCNLYFQTSVPNNGG
jgi:hypothetical protein